MEIIGGLRDRLIRDNLYNELKAGLEYLDWFDSGRQHRPVDFRSEPIGHEKEALPNIVTLSFEDHRSRDYELGSYASEHTQDVWLDVYAESYSVGMHLTGDLKALIGGRFNFTGIQGQRLSVLSLHEATPTHQFYVEIDRIYSDRSRVYSKPFEEFAWMINFTITDWYGTE